MSVISGCVLICLCFVGVSMGDPGPINWVGKNKIIFYSPAVIGQDPHVNKIDIYTSFFEDLHLRDLDLIVKIGAQTVIVGENWAADGSNVHQTFMDHLLERNLSLVITYAIPMKEADTSTDDTTTKNTLRDKAKEAFVLLLKEFSIAPKYMKLVYGYYIPTPDVQKMSTKDLADYFFLINELISLMNDAGQQMIAGFPIDPREGTVPVYDFTQVRNDIWAVDIFSYDTLDKSIDQYTNTLPSESLKPMWAVIRIDSFDYNYRAPNETQQAMNMSSTLAQMYQYSTEAQIAGVVVHEFSDEWWRGDLSQVGYAAEGCPNSNPYAHTPCGIVTYVSILSLEYTGLFKLRDEPLKFCILPKLSLASVQQEWVEKENYIDLNATFCAGLPQPVPWYIIPVAGGLSLIAFILLLVCPPPKAPVSKGRKLEIYDDNLL